MADLYATAEVFCIPGLRPSCAKVEITAEERAKGAGAYS
jgi:hypothetical protein